MKLNLKGFSQDVSLENPEEILYFLVFDADGTDVKLPVQKETTEALINLIYSGEDNGSDSPTDVDFGMGEVGGNVSEGNHLGLNTGQPGRARASSRHHIDEADEEEQAEEDEGPKSEEEIESL